MVQAAAACINSEESERAGIEEVATIFKRRRTELLYQEEVQFSPAVVVLLTVTHNCNRQ